MSRQRKRRLQVADDLENDNNNNNSLGKRLCNTAADFCCICYNSDIENKTLLKGCLHAFCNKCIKQWTEAQLAVPNSSNSTPSSIATFKLVTPVCPLCKNTYNCYYSNIMSEQHFKEENIEQQIVEQRQLKEDYFVQCMLAIYLPQRFSMNFNNLPLPLQHAQLFINAINIDNIFAHFPDNVNEMIVKTLAIRIFNEIQQ